ncbi:MAG: F0F1 ATP synthase subunit A [Clostridiaceae bacterium]|nr:F0F1 ATP synthase subunit A [Oscillospiraceae bacterium]NLO62447.1 F0F1 ATP synthase subunit A [Clostridiaceae bacterium]
MKIGIILSAGEWLERYFRALGDRLIEEIMIGDIGGEIGNAILQIESYFDIGNEHFLLTDAVIATWLALIPSIVFWMWMASKRERIPAGRQTVTESLVGLLMSLCIDNGMNRKQAAEVTSMVGTIALFLLSANIISVFNIRPPAKNIAFPIAMALFAIVYVIVISIRFVGIKGFMASLVYPMKAMLPFRILEYLIKPLSLSLRLFGNIFGAFILMEFIRIIVPAVLPGVLMLWFDVADGLLQAVVFAYLTINYIGEVLEGAEAAHKKEIVVKAPAVVLSSD